MLDHLRELSRHTWVAPNNIAVICAGLEEKDQASLSCFLLLCREFVRLSFEAEMALPFAFTDAATYNVVSLLKVVLLMHWGGA